MSRRRCLLAASLAGALLAAGCGSSTGQTATQVRPATPPSLATSLVTPSGTWAVAVLGGSAASHNNFWQLFVRPTGSGTWRLATPPGVASNGGLVLAGLPAGSVLAGFRPSQDLTYSPLATSTDTGRAWSPGLLDAALADVPDALAANPASGHLLALLSDGTTDTSGPGGTAWTRLATRQAIAGSPAGTRCGLGSLTAATFGPAGQPMLAAGCNRPGTVGIFAWSTDGGTRWTLSPALPLNHATLTAASSGPGGSLAVILSDRHAATITSGGNSWQTWPVLPTGTVTLAAGPAGGWNALAVRGTQLTIWQAAPGARSWSSEQAIKVPVQFGSSG